MDDLQKTNTDIIKRIITGAVYVVVVVGLCAAKWLIPEGYGALLFDALFCAIAVIGSMELLRALGCVSVLQRAITITFSALCVPLFVAMQMLTGSGWLGLIDALGVGMLVICVLFVADHSRSTLKSTLASLFTLLYAGLLTALLSAINYLEENSMLAILILFVCVPFTDAFAYLVGLALGRFVPLKLAPNVSPNKTVIGALGGLIGGIGGSVAVYYVFMALGGTPEFSGTLPGVVAIVLIGFAASVATQFGDLFESEVKRECRVKDMGRLLPGHGGVMDRFDGTLFAGIVILIAFLLIA